MHPRRAHRRPPGRPRPVLLLGLVCGLGCGDKEESAPCPDGYTESADGHCLQAPSESDTDSDTDTDTDTDTDSDTDTDTDTDTDADTDTDTDTDTDADYTVCDDSSGLFTTIQDAIDAAGAGETITVCPGTFGGFDITTGDQVHVQGAGVEGTTLSANLETLIEMDGGSLELSELSLSGYFWEDNVYPVFNGTGGDLHFHDARVADIEAGTGGQDGSGTAFRIGEMTATIENVEWEDNEISGYLLEVVDADQATFRHCIFHDNEQTDSGADRMLNFARSNLEFSNNLVYSNAFGSAIFSSSDADTYDIWVFNNTFHGNFASSAMTVSTAADVDNNIFSENDAGGLSGWCSNCDYNDAYGNGTNFSYNIEGTGNLEDNPRMTDPDNQDFSLSSFSPCIDAGNPQSGYNDVDGTRNDMGAFGGPYGVWP